MPVGLGRIVQGSVAKWIASYVGWSCRRQRFSFRAFQDFGNARHSPPRLLLKLAALNVSPGKISAALVAGHVQTYVCRDARYKIVETVGGINIIRRNLRIGAGHSVCRGEVF